MTSSNTDLVESVAPDLSKFSPSDARRIALTASCTDTRQLPTVDDAGEFRTVDGVPVQVMHNSIVVEKDGYCGPWLTEIVRQLRGFHEPQEELVFARILERIGVTSKPPSMIELGSWWAYYSLWFRKQYPNAPIVDLEPDEPYLDVGRRNFVLNGEKATFVHGAIGDMSLQTLEFIAESDGKLHRAPVFDVKTLMDLGQMDDLTILLADIQGAELPLLEQLPGLVETKQIRFVLISTHHHSISGDALTHQRVLDLMQRCGGHVIAEHTVGESFSGDGLVAVSFDPQDSDFVVEITRARQRDSLFGELEPELAKAMSRATEAEARNKQLDEELEMARQELFFMRQSRAWRWSKGLRWTRTKIQRN